MINKENIIANLYKKNNNNILITKKSILLLNKLENNYSDCKGSLPSFLLRRNEGQQINTKLHTTQENKQLNNNENKLITINSINPDNVTTLKYIDNIHEYLKSLKTLLPIFKKRGLSIKYIQNNSYFFNKGNKINTHNQISIASIESTNKLLKSLFKSLYCIISKPVFLITGDKIIIQLFYYLNIPKQTVYKWFNIFNNNRIKSYYKKINKIKFILSIKNRFFKNKFKKSYFNLSKRFFKLTNYDLRSKNNNLLILKLFKNSLNKVYEYKFKIICNILSKKFNRPVELQLTRLHQPYQDSNILVNLITMNLKFKKKSAILLQKIYKKRFIKDLNFLPKIGMKNNTIYNIRPNAIISGLNIKIAGRLMREPIIPRLTKKNIAKGARATGKVNFLDISSITSKNKKGAFTIKIVSGQNFYL